MDNPAIFVIRDYIDSHLFEPKKNWDSRYFEERSYARWAADEIISRLIDQEPISPWDSFYKDIKPTVEVIDDFIYELNDLLMKTTKEKNRFIFSTALDTAYGILALLEYRIGW